MLRLLIEEIESAKQNIDLYPQLSSYRTLETVQKAKERWGGYRLTLVIGSVSQPPRWYQVEDLLRQVQLLVVPRPGYARKG